MYGLLLTLHVVVCVLLVVAVLLQSGKGSDIGAVFGGAGTQALFGSAGPADFLNKATRVMVVVFMLTSLILGYFAFERPNRSIMEGKAKAPKAVQIPIKPGQLNAPTIPLKPGAPVNAAPAKPAMTAPAAAPVAPAKTAPAQPAAHPAPANPAK